MIQKILQIRQIRDQFYDVDVVTTILSQHLAYLAAISAISQLASRILRYFGGRFGWCRCTFGEGTAAAIIAKNQFFNVSSRSPKEA